MLRNRRLSLLLAICVTIFGLSRIAAQDATPISPPTETSIPTLLPTEIPTDLPSAMPLPTLTPPPLPTEMPTLLPTPTASDTATETPTETPTLQASASPTETLTAEPSLTLATTPSETVVASPSPSATVSELPTLYSDSFETPQFNQWFSDIRKSIVSVANGHALHITSANSYLSLGQGNVLDVAFQVDMNLSSGIASIGVRHSGAGYYRVAFNANGTISLYRTDQILASIVTSPFIAGQWRTVKLSVNGNILRVAIDNTEVLNFTDTVPLPSGTMFVAGNVETVNDFLLDNLIVQGTIAQSQMQSSTTFAVPLNNQQLSAQVPNSAIPSGTSQRIVYARDVSTSGIPFYQLYMMDDCGGNQTQLLPGLTSQYFPDLNVQGQIAFNWDFTGSFEIYTMNNDGSNLSQRTFSAGFPHAPSYSPDGSSLTFERGGELYILNLNTNEEYHLAAGQGYKSLPKWSPNGPRITFQNYINNGFDIFAVNTDGSNLVPLTSIHTASQPDWSSDGSEIVFLQEVSPAIDTLWVIDSSTGAFHRQLIDDTIVPVQWPAWSQDGSRVVYSSGNSSGTSDPGGPYILSVSSGVAGSPPPCNLGTLTGAGHNPNFGLIPSVQATAVPTVVPSATPNTNSPTTPTIEECNSIPYKWWVKNKHTGTYPRPNLITYESHHGVPTSYFRDALVPLLANLGVNIPYSHGLAPTIEMPQTDHYRATTLWNGILDDWNRSLFPGVDWKDVGIPWTAMVGDTPGEFGRGSIVDRLMDAGGVPQNCRELYKKALKEYLKFILCKVEQSILRALIANPANQAAQALKQIVDWLGGVDAIFNDCPGIW